MGSFRVGCMEVIWGWFGVFQRKGQIVCLFLETERKLKYDEIMTDF